MYCIVMYEKSGIRRYGKEHFNGDWGWGMGD